MGCLPLGQAVSRRVRQCAPALWYCVVTQRRLLGFHVRTQHQLSLAGRKKGHIVSLNVMKAAVVSLLNLPSIQGLIVEVTPGFPEGEHSSSHILGSKQGRRGFYLGFFALSLPC